MKKLKNKQHNVKDIQIENQMTVHFWINSWLNLFIGASSKKMELFYCLNCCNKLFGCVRKVYMKLLAIVTRKEKKEFMMISSNTPTAASSKIISGLLSHYENEEEKIKKQSYYLFKF